VISAFFFGARKIPSACGDIEFLKIKNIRVECRGSVDSAAVIAKAGIEPGISMINLNIRQVCARIAGNPRIGRVLVKRRLPNTLIISVFERKPVAMIHSGTIYLTDRDGFLWPLASHACWDLPVITGLSDTLAGDRRRLTKSSVSRLNGLLDAVREAGEKGNPMRISQAVFTSHSSIRLKLESNTAWVELDDSRIPDRLKKARRILALEEKKNGSIPQRINLCYGNLAFVR
jgi:cell division septal protein FtsQ